MIPRILIDTARIPGGDEMSLYSRGDDFMIVIDRNELMSTRMNGSEIALATMALARISGVAAPQDFDGRVLIGGYGMGFTLRAVLGAVGPGAGVTVAELVPEILAWARGPMAAVAAGCLDDARVRIVEEDVAVIIAAGAGQYDAILLDVDNGPDGLVRADNDRLYAPRGLAAAKAALRPGGVLAVWSAGPDAKFVRRLKEAGFAVDEVAVKARTNGKGPRHVIWFATAR